MSESLEHLRFLYGLQHFGIKLGLRNIRELLRFLCNPERQFPCIHIAGTNGKGSTAAMVASILTASGYRTGLYTSPHLINFNERIRVDGKTISDAEVAHHTAILKPRIRKLKATFFEATTAIAFKQFSDRHVDIAVVETGLGGRFDATNVVTPRLSVITNIGLEHTEHLGTTYAGIAFEKGGIMKPGIPCLTATMNREALRMLKKIANANKSRILLAQDGSSVTANEYTLEGSIVDLQTDGGTYRDVFVSLVGEHQLRNLQLAVLSVEHLKAIDGFSNITRQTVVAGLRQIRELSGLRGRLDLIQRSPVIIADVAHNPDGMKALVFSLRFLCASPLVAVFGVLKDKDHRRMLDYLLPLARLIIAVRPDTQRALGAMKIVDGVHEMRAKAWLGNSVENGLILAMNERRREEPILVVGSHYVVGEAMQAFQISV